MLGGGVGTSHVRQMWQYSDSEHGQPKSELQTGGGGPRAGLRRFSAQHDQRWSMLIVKLGAVAPLTAVRRICTDRTYKLKSRMRGHFCTNRGFLYEICNSTRHCGLSCIL